MESEAIKYIGVGLTAFGMLGSAIGVGNIFVAMLNGISRNPSTEQKMAKYLYVGAGLSEAMGLFALVIALMLMFAV